IHDVQGAQQRPSGGARVTTQSFGGVVRPAILTSVPSRVTWALPVPRRGIFRTYLAVADAPGEAPAPGNPRPSISFRVGISDHRTYETLAVVPGDGRGWTELRVDLSGYAGWQWSIFYRPDRTNWNLVLA